MIERKKFIEIVSDIYNKTEEEFEQDIIEDWEQVFFDRLEKKLETDTEKVIAHIFYADDDSIDDVAQGILDDLTQETLLQSVCFDADSETTVVVCMVAK